MGIINKTNKEKNKIDVNIAQKTMLVVENEEDTKINQLIREKYSLSQELSLLRKKIVGVLNDEEWNEYNEYVNECITKAREDTLHQD